MTHNNQNRNILSAEIRRQIGSDQMKRFIRSLPAFAASPEIPEHLDRLVRKLDRTETPALSRKRQN